MPRSKHGRTDLIGAHRTTREKVSAFYIRWTAWRGAGAPVIGSYRGATRADAEAAERADAAERAARYADAASGKSDTSTIAGVLEAFERSSDFTRGLSASTRAVWASAMKTMRANKLGAMQVRLLKSDGATRALTRWRDNEAKMRGDRAADLRMQILKRALNWAKLQNLVAANPALGIEEIYRSDRSDLIWEAEHIETYRAKILKLRAETLDAGGPNRAKQLHALQVAEDALMIALFTGLRRGDIAGLRREEIRDGAIVLAPRKAARRALTAKKKPRVVVIPILPEIGPIIERRLALAGPSVFSTAPTKQNPNGSPYSPAALGRMVSEIAAATRQDGPPWVKIDRHLHDARGSFVTYVRARGLITREEVADMLGWSEADVRDIERRYLSNDAVVSATLERLKRATGAA